MGSEAVGVLLRLFFYTTLWLNAFIAIWMLFSYTGKDYATKPGFKRLCWRVAIRSGFAFTMLILGARFWWEFQLPSFSLLNYGVIDYIICFAPAYSPVLCFALGKTFTRQLLGPLPSDVEYSDIARLLRLGIWGGHGLMVLPTMYLLL